MAKWITLSERDHDALEEALAAARSDPDHREQISAMLTTRDPLDVAEFAAQCCQRRTLGLRPWESPPCWLDPGDKADTSVGAELLREMLELGVSRWDPDPRKALDQAKRRLRTVTLQ